MLLAILPVMPLGCLVLAAAILELQAFAASDLLFDDSRVVSAALAVAEWV